jgi:hypothetical protein
MNKSADLRVIALLKVLWEISWVMCMGESTKTFIYHGYWVDSE